MFEQRSDVALHRLELVKLQIGIDDGENIPGSRLFVNENPPAIADELLFYLQQALAFEHDRQDIGRRDVLRIVELNELPQERFGVFFLNRLVWWGRRMVNAVPVGDEAFALASAFAELPLPAALANIRTLKVGFFVEEQRVIGLFIGKVRATRPAGVSTGLNIPLGHEISPKRSCILRP